MTTQTLTEAAIDELQVTLLRLAIKLGNDELEGKFAALCALAKLALSARVGIDGGVAQEGAGRVSLLTEQPAINRKMLHAETEDGQSVEHENSPTINALSASAGGVEEPKSFSVFRKFPIGTDQREISDYADHLRASLGAAQGEIARLKDLAHGGRAMTLQQIADDEAGL